MMEKRTVVDQVEVRRDGLIQIRFAKQITDGGTILKSDYHRAAVQPGDDVATLWDAITAGLMQSGEAAPGAADRERVRRLVETEHTPQVVAKYRARLAAATGAALAAGASTTASEPGEGDKR